MQKNKHKKKIIIGLLLFSTFLGVLLAKVAPMQAGHGFSALFSQKSEDEKVKTTESTKEKAIKEVVEQPSYVDVVNDELRQGKFNNRLPIKLLLQTDERWKATPYGFGNPEGNTLEINGCAILSLTMVSSFLDDKDYTPQDILNWSKNDYYMEGEGTAWAIFSDFALEKGYQFEDLETNIAAVEEQLKQNHPVIISVKPGMFTNTGHIMVISGMDNGKFWLNDPNDSEVKGHSRKEFTSEELLNEAMNFWTIYKQ